MSKKIKKAKAKKGKAKKITTSADAPPRNPDKPPSGGN